MSVLHALDAVPAVTIADAVAAARQLVERAIVRRGLSITVPGAGIWAWECRECSARWNSLANDPAARLDAHHPNCLAAKVLEICAEVPR